MGRKKINKPIIITKYQTGKMYSKDLRGLIGKDTIRELRKKKKDFVIYRAIDSKDLTEEVTKDLLIEELNRLDFTVENLENFINELQWKKKV